MIFFFILLFISLFLIVPTQIYAVCPVCTVAVGVGLGLSRWLGIDDTVSGVWIGGLVISSSLWLASYLDKRKINIPFKELISIALFYLFVIPPLYLTGIMGHVYNTLWGIDKLLLGIIFGSLLFIGSVLLDKYLRKTNNGKVYFSYQRIILPISFLLIGSGIFYLLTK